LSKGADTKLGKKGKDSERISEQSRVRVQGYQRPTDKRERSTQLEEKQFEVSSPQRTIDGKYRCRNCGQILDTEVEYNRHHRRAHEQSAKNYGQQTAKS
jgi:uncharacterized C2H2 Zn-finger protein